MRLQRNSSAAVLLPCLLAALPAAASEEHAGGFWPQFRGPDRDNRSTETGLLEQWPDGGPRLLWKSKVCGRGYATVSVAEGRLYTSGDFGSEEMVVALDLQGQPLWKSSNGAAWRGATPGARCTPTYREGIVYHLNPTGRLAAFRAATGKELWAVDLEERYEASWGPWALAESVVVEEDNVLCVPGGTKGRIVAVNRLTGGPVWANTSITERAAYCSPVVVEHDGVRQLVTFLRESVASVDVRTGRLLWTHEHDTPYDMNVTSPVFHDGRVHFSSGYGTGGRLLELGPGSRSVKQVWTNPEQDNCHTGVILVGGYLYGSGCRQSERGFVCVEFLTGKTMWTDRDVWKVSLTYADGHLYCLGHEGAILLLKPNPERCIVVSRFQLPSRDRYDNLAYPVVCGGRLYLRQGEELRAYDVKGAAPSGE
jgi:outer membrane protein assembly factor BamB